MSIQIHKPFANRKLNGLVNSIKNSPYPLWYTLLWPYYFNRPSIFKWSRNKKLPSKQLLHNGKLTDETSIVYAGDIMVLNGDQVPILSPELSSLISSADLFVANCEAPVGQHKIDADKKYSFLFHMPYDFFEGIFKQTTLSYDRIVLTNANNHSGDAGELAHYRSYEILTRLGITVLGLNNKNILQKKYINNHTLGFCGWTHWLNCDVFSQLDAPLQYSDIKNIDFFGVKKKNEIDFLIGMPHWEYEFQHFPKPSTKKIAHDIILSGIDLIVGSHPHVLQPFEIINNKLCLYSLGNFCGLGVAWPVKIIPLVKTVIGKDIEGNTRIKEYETHFFYQYHTHSQIIIKPIDDVNMKMFNSAKKRINRLVQWD